MRGTYLSPWRQCTALSCLIGPCILAVCFNKPPPAGRPLPPFPSLGGVVDEPCCHRCCNFPGAAFGFELFSAFLDTTERDALSTLRLGSTQIINSLPTSWSYTAEQYFPALSTTSNLILVVVGFCSATSKNGQHILRLVSTISCPSDTRYTGAPLTPLTFLVVAELCGTVAVLTADLVIDRMWLAYA